MPKGHPSLPIPLLSALERRKLEKIRKGRRRRLRKRGMEEEEEEEEKIEDDG